MCFAYLMQSVTKLVWKVVMSYKSTGGSRRELLRSIAVGSGAIVTGRHLPENWTKPIVDSVILPAHAQISPSCSDDLMPTAQLDVALQDLNNACRTVVDPTRITNSTAGGNVFYDNTIEQSNTPLQIANVNLTNIMADFGEFNGEVYPDG